MDQYLYWFLTRKPWIKGAYVALTIVALVFFCLLSFWVFSLILQPVQ